MAQSNPNDTTKILSYIVVALIAFSGGYLVRHLTGKVSGEAPSGEAHQGSAAAPSDGAPAGDSDKIAIGDAPVQGPENAPVTIVEYSDFQCPFCQKGFKRLEKVKKNFPEDVRIVFKHYPLPFHKQAKPAARAAMAAREQGDKYFWKMHDKLFETQKQWKSGGVEDLAAGWAKEFGMDVEKFKKDLKNNKDAYNKTIQAQMDEGSNLGVKGTPHFFINGQALSGAQPYAKFESAVKGKLKQAKKMLKNGVERSELYGAAVAKNFKEAKQKKKKPKKKKQKVAYVPVSDKDAARGASASDALVTLVAFSDFQCPFCDKAVPTIEKIAENHGDKVRIVFKHRPLGFHKKAKPAAKAAIAAQQQGKFWEMHDLLFENQKSLGNYEKFAEQLGLNVDKFKSAMESEATQKQLQADIEVANKVGANGTPNFFVNGKQVVGAQPYSKFKSIINEQVKTAQKLKDDKGLSGEKLYKAVVEVNKENAESAAADAPSPKPKKKKAKKVDTSKLKIGESPAKGPADAPITIYEFSDFQCPYCSKAHATVKKVMKEYKGKVRLVHKHYPLPFHQNAKPAAKASMAAQKQDKFWEMYDLLFKNQGNLGQDGIYEKLARKVGLNVEKFKKDMESIPASRIKNDMSMGKKVGVRGTPAFFINGKRLVGAQPFARFKSIIDSELGG